MIRINLLPRKKKRASRSVSVEGEKVVGVGFGILIAGAAMIFLFIHTPMVDEVDAQIARNQKITADNKKLKSKTKDFDDLKAAFKAAQAQAASIEALNNARATPANFLFELSTILKKRGEPTTTAAMDTALEENENLQWQDGWDPQHVWIRGITEKGGVFTIKGSAQSDGDVTQLAHRLAASMYFDDVRPEGSTKKKDKLSGISVYEFKITGKVRY